MFPGLFALQRQALQSWLDATRLRADRPLGERLLLAPGEAVLRSLEGATGQVAASLLDSVRRHAGWAVREEVLDEQPFVTIRRFAIGERTAPTILVIAPHSGYATSVLGQLVAMLVRDAQVVVTDWRNARDVPLAAGRFGLDQQVALCERLIATHAAGAAVVALSQSTVPALAATALLAEAEPAHAPARLALLGGPIDARIEPPSMLAMLRSVPFAAWSPALLQIVTPPFAGVGRRVYPGAFQLAAYASASPTNYLRAQAGLVLELIGGIPQGHAELHADLHAVVDVPGELFAETLERILLDSAMAEGRFVTGGGRTVDPTRIERTALLTLEAGSDELVGRGQTHAAHTICTALPEAFRHRATLDGLLHHDLFVGPTFTERTAPVLAGFLREASAAPAAARKVSPAGGRAARRRGPPAPGG